MKRLVRRGMFYGFICGTVLFSPSIPWWGQVIVCSTMIAMAWREREAE